MGPNGRVRLAGRLVESGLTHSNTTAPASRRAQRLGFKRFPGSLTHHYSERASKWIYNGIVRDPSEPGASEQGTTMTSAINPSLISLFRAHDSPIRGLDGCRSRKQWVQQLQTHPTRRPRGCTIGWHRPSTVGYRPLNTLLGLDVEDQVVFS